MDLSTFKAAVKNSIGGDNDHTAKIMNESEVLLAMAWNNGAPDGKKAEKALDEEISFQGHTMDDKRLLALTIAIQAITKTVEEITSPKAATAAPIPPCH